jgi:hypothetical protein
MAVDRSYGAVTKRREIDCQFLVIELTAILHCGGDAGVRDRFYLGIVWDH